ncbi:DUF1836 domain-containing protein [Agrilactobacillus fermenti]|uniref:DUF1836 domain-containing protein n=1 Tax=Agrilactobacillus fermenti TaxID=2586909 RepID=UPI003A5C6F0F
MTANHTVIAKLPNWDDLPSFGLQLKQLIEVANSFIVPITGQQITKTMIQNYFKDGVLDTPEHQTYERKQVAGAIVVGMLKNVFSLNEIRNGLHWILTESAPQSGYDNFVNIFNEQAAENLLEPKSLKKIKLKSPSQSTIMQYGAVQTVLFWLFTKNFLQDGSRSGSTT